MSVAEKRLARERLHQLVIDEEPSSTSTLSRQSLLNAYRLKSELQAREERDTTSHCLIRTMDPIIIPPSKKFEHRPGARITPITYKSALTVSLTAKYANFHELCT